MHRFLDMEEKTSPLKQQSEEHDRVNSRPFVLKWFNFDKGFNSIKAVSICFAGLIAVNTGAAYNKISPANANKITNLLLLLSGASVVLEQYIDYRTVRSYQKNKKR
jgi:hypothetical protein